MLIKRKRPGTDLEGSHPRGLVSTTLHCEQMRRLQRLGHRLSRSAHESGPFRPLPQPRLHHGRIVGRVVRRRALQRVDSAGATRLFRMALLRGAVCAAMNAAEPQRPRRERPDRLCQLQTVANAMPVTRSCRSGQKSYMCSPADGACRTESRTIHAKFGRIFRLPLALTFIFCSPSLLVTRVALPAVLPFFLCSSRFSFFAPLTYSSLFFFNGNGDLCARERDDGALWSS